jgi:two-component system response regulator DegU
MRVLIVDDDRAVREMLKRLLQDIAEVVGECADGSESLGAYQRLRPDWVLMDLQMKEVDGLTAIRQIVSADPEAKVLMVTIHNDWSLLKAAREAGARGYVPKENLLEIRRWLR